MSATLAAVPSEIITNRERISWRIPYGNLSSVLQSARDEVEKGQLENAWTAYTIALEQWLQATWREVSGKSNSPVTGIEQLATKLRGRDTIDTWQLQSIRLTTNRPLPVAWRHIDVLSAIVESLTN